MKEVVYSFILLFAFTFPCALALYDSSDNVVELTSSNFKSQVLNDDSIWIVEFFAPWCGHCKNLVPEYKKLAKALKGIVKVGAVDMTQHQSVGAPYNVQGFPTIKIFGNNKNKPSDYNGQRQASAFIEAAINEIRSTANARLGARSKSTEDNRRGGGSADVIVLTDSNFEETVLKSKDLWLVEFYAPWCGHCKNLEPHWKAAATQLKGKVKLGALDATVHTAIANQFGIRGFPTIKFFGGGVKSLEDAIDYDGGRTTDDIVNWANAKAAESLPPPELKQAVSDAVVDEVCKDKQLCIVAFLPHILDCQSACRNDYLKILKEQTEKFKKNPWGWIWMEAGQQPDVEEAFGVGGFGYPAMVAVNPRKLKYSTLTGSFGADGITEFLKDLLYGKSKSQTLRSTEFPKFATVEPWDGKDGEPIQEEEVDLSDVELDDLDKQEL